MQETFGKEEKLKSSQLISKLFAEGKGLTVYPLKLIYLPLEHHGPQPVKAAVSVSKRLFGNAVKRNKIKRLMREAYRKNKYLVLETSHTKKYIFMFIYLSKEEPQYQPLQEKMQKLLQKFIGTTS